ncbi:hypothetical protein [Streptomyces sp. B3I8]|uniref:hypothetical protein n=1 Tax=Streptomyces sp. B3I8 TaxID=3042303 RepID=UPI0027816C8C|nr:hypothetical protein [Streptomyces sp. B3I8]MDQ0786612.1 hypothetical protein [Streptomyces sp. B3I8]
MPIPSSAADPAAAPESSPEPDVPVPDPVTRLLCSALYVRPSRIGERLRERRLRRERTRRRTRCGRRRTLYLDDEGSCPPLGEAAAQWSVRQVLRGPRLPVPSFGLDLIPMVAHRLGARRVRRLR